MNNFTRHISPGRFLMILPGRADLQGEVPPFLVSPGLDQRSRRRWIWKFQQFGHCWSSHLKRMLPPSRDDHMNIFTALKVTKRPHAGSMPSWNIYCAEKTNTEKMYLSMERYPIDTLFQTFRSLFWGGVYLLRPAGNQRGSYNCCWAQDPWNGQVWNSNEWFWVWSIRIWDRWQTN